MDATPPANGRARVVRETAPTRAPARTSSPRVWIVAAVLVVAATAVLFAVHHGLSSSHDQFDLRIYFAAMHWWGDGNDLYTYGRYDPVMGILGFTYPPFAAMLMSPMALLGWRTVQALTVASILGAAIVTVHLVLAERFRIPRHRLLPVAAGVTAASFLLLPIRQTLQFGQVNLFLAVLVLVDLLVLTRRGSRLGGVGVGLAMAIKIVPGIFLLYLVLARQWRAAITGAATCAAAWLLAAVVAPAASWEYFTSLLWDTRRVGILASPSNQSVDGLLARIAAPEQPGTLLFLAAVLIVAVPAARRIRAAATCGDTLAAVTITGLLGVLLSPVSWLHHCVWVLPAMVVIGHRVFMRARQFPAVHGGVAGVLYDPVARHAALRLGGVLALGLTGLAVFVTDTRDLLNLPMTDLSDLSAAQILGCSLQVLWMLAAMFLLPLLPARVRDRKPTDAAVRD